MLIALRASWAFLERVREYEISKNVLIRICLAPYDARSDHVSDNLETTISGFAFESSNWCDGINEFD